VLVPVAVLLMRAIRNDIAAYAEKAELWVRRWALVLTVFLAGAVVIGDLITLVNYFLGGELTTRFVLKVLVLLLVAGAVFLHFFADLKGYWKSNPDKAKLVGLGAGAVVLLTIVAGFFILGSPADVRLMRFDNQKISDLQSIQWELVTYWQRKEVLPATLDELHDPLNAYAIPVDSQTGEQYGYERTSNSSFRLCAVFNHEGDDPYAYPRRPSPELGRFEVDTWQHGIGERCFERSIDPERYSCLRELFSLTLFIQLVSLIGEEEPRR
jgi:hypothetical protein